MRDALPLHCGYGKTGIFENINETRDSCHHCHKPEIPRGEQSRKSHRGDQIQEKLRTLS